MAVYAQLVVDSRRWGAVGILESLKVVPRVIGGYFRARAFLGTSPPGVFVPIDFGFVNIKLARFAKTRGWRVVYFIPPGSWRRTKQGADLPAVADVIVTPFAWSAEILTKMGATAHYWGHPLAEMVAVTPDAETRDGVAILPGSRDHEIKHNLKVISEALAGYSGKICFGVAANLDPAVLERTWEDLGGAEAEFCQDTYAALKSSRTALVCSGTATLESALCDCPTVVLYRGSKAMEVEAAIRKPKYKFVALPNILLDRRVLPELIQQEATPERIRAEWELISAAGDPRDAQLHSFAELRTMLAGAGCLDRTAELIRSLTEAL